MDKVYAAAALYAFADIDDYIDMLDQSVMKKALASRCDHRPADIQAYDIVDIIILKENLISFRNTVQSILNRFTDEELSYFRYKYFNDKTARSDYNTRGYFRMQRALLRTFGCRLYNKGFDEKWFNDN